MKRTQLATQFINHFNPSAHPILEDALDFAERYVSDWRAFEPDVTGIALLKIKNFLDRYESSEAMKNYYASYGRGETFYTNMLLLEGALND